MSVHPLLLAGIAAFAAVTLGSPSLDACIHPPEKTELTPADQQVLLLHKNGVETIVVQFAYNSKKPLKKLGVVFPVPSTPRNYSAQQETFFDSLHDWYKPEKQVRAKTKSRGKAAAPPELVQLTPVKVGPFDIQPLKATNAKAVNKWLKTHKLRTISEDALKSYIDREWTFLVVELNTEGKETNTGRLPPLAVTFDSETLTYPLDLQRPTSAKHALKTPIRFFTLTDRKVDEAIPSQVYDYVGRLGHALGDGEAVAVPKPFAGVMKATGFGPEEKAYPAVFEMRLMNRKGHLDAQAETKTFDDLVIPLMKAEPAPAVEKEPEAKAPDAGKAPVKQVPVQQPPPPAAQPQGCSTTDASPRLTLLLLFVAGLVVRRRR